MKNILKEKVFILIVLGSSFEDNDELMFFLTKSVIDAINN